MGLHYDNNQPAEWNLNKSLARLDLMCDENGEELIIEGIKMIIPDGRKI